jgi:outer membrane lipoprotein-sorting protein
MSPTRAWDRAASLPVAATGRPRAELAALGATLPSVAELFTFMRDAELRFETLRMQIEERTRTTRGELVSVVDLALRHPGRARVMTTGRVGESGESRYDIWLGDGETVRTYNSSRRVGTRRPVRRQVRGASDNPDLPGMSRVYAPVTQLPMESLPELFVHPAGYCQNVLATGDCAHPRTVEATADRPDHAIRIAVDRADGVILRVEESVGGVVSRDARVTRYEPDATLPPGAFELTFPPDTTFIY